jgi:hypothetical protein
LSIKWRIIKHLAGSVGSRDGRFGACPLAGGGCFGVLRHAVRPGRADAGDDGPEASPERLRQEGVQDGVDAGVAVRQNSRNDLESKFGVSADGQAQKPLFQNFWNFGNFENFGKAGQQQKTGLLNELSRTDFTYL